MNHPVATQKIKVAEFLEIEVEPNFIYELINGEIVKKGAPNPKHQVTSGKLYRLLTNFIDQKELGTIYMLLWMYSWANTTRFNLTYSL